MSKIPCGGFEFDDSLEIRDGKLSAKSALNKLSEEIENLPIGGAPSWNDLKDKPFYDESNTLFEWDGDATGHETIEFIDGLSLVYLGDSIIDPSVLIGATATITNGVDEASTVINGDDIQEKFENVYVVAVEESGFYLVTADNTTVSYGDISFTFPYAGIYVAPKELYGGIYLSSIVKTVIKKIDNKFLPTVCGKTADAKGNISLEASDVGAAKLFVVTETSNGVVDKSGEQIRDAYLAGNVVILVPRERSANIMYLLTVGIKGHINPEGYKFFSVGISSDLYIPYFRTATVYSNKTVTYKTEELARYERSRSSITLDSSTEGSTKRFNITVDDSGTISAKEI